MDTCTGEQVFLCFLLCIYTVRIFLAAILYYLSEVSPSLVSYPTFVLVQYNNPSCLACLEESPASALADTLPGTREQSPSQKATRTHLDSSREATVFPLSYASPALPPHLTYYPPPFSPCPLSRCPPIPPRQMLSISSVAREAVNGPRQTVRGEGISEGLQSENDMGDETADHSTLEAGCYVESALCAARPLTDLHSAFSSALFTSDETDEAWVNGKWDRYRSVKEIPAAVPRCLYHFYYTLYMCRYLWSYLCTCVIISTSCMLAA